MNKLIKRDVIMRQIKKSTPGILKQIIKEEKEKLQKENKSLLEEKKYKKHIKKLSLKQKKLLKEIKNILILKKLLRKKLTKGL